MSWRKYFKTAAAGGALSPISGASMGAQSNFKFQNYGSLLPEVYCGHPNRIERYSQYMAMDADSEVNSALDIISEFCTQTNRENGTAFDLHFYEKPTETEISILKKQLQAWYSLNQFESRMFKMFRNVLMYGDQVFLRDPETFKLYWVDMTNVTKVIVNESQGKEPEQYVLRNVNPNFENLTVTQVTADNFYHTMPNTSGYGAAAYNMPNNPYSSTGRFTQDIREMTFDAEHILHMSLSEGLDSSWPFGNSILENVFKVYKQKELLEDSIIIYRVQRAPERRVFKIDVGNMPSHMAMAFVERVKNEIHQRRIPTQSGGCFDMNTKVPLLDGRICTISELATEFQQGKQNWAYSCDPTTGQMVPGLITWAGVTNRDAKVLKLTLDNGQTIICTPDHKFPIIGKGKVEAQNIVVNEDSLISFHTRKFSINENDNSNHKVVSIEVLENTMDVGTLTIDGNEIYHNFHTFAIEQGVYTFNSNFMDSTYSPLGINEDYFFPQSCLSLDTSIKLLDGRDVPLTQLIQEYKEGKENFVYTVNQNTLDIEPGKIVWADVTRKNTQVVEVLLDNGEKIICTPDHRFIMRDGTEVEAQHLIQDQSVMPLYLVDAKTGKHQGANKYLKYICPKTGKSRWVHTMVCPKASPGPKTEIHHIDLNSKNNNPTNLVEMETKAHRQLHKELGTYHLTNAWKDQEKRAKLVNGIREYHKNASPADKKMMQERGRRNGAATWANPVASQKIKESLRKTQSRIAKAKKITYSESMALRMIEMFNEGHDSIPQITKALRVDSRFQAAFHEANSNILRDSNKSKDICPTDTTLNRMCQLLGYKTWGEFKSQYAFNHKVVSVTWLPELIDTGDITIESSNNNHNFALTSGVFVHNSEGRGSSVETLPGGCLAMDTRVVLLDGRVLSIAELTDEYRQGKENWTYSCDPSSGKVVPGIISWAGVTQESAQVMKITLDNEKTITCTSDHKFPVPGKGLVEAKDLCVNQLLYSVTGTDLASADLKIVQIEILSEPIQVGTLTIDVDEKYHDYHNFALECGVFTQNSNLGEIDDLKFFTNKLFRGLRIPSSYLPTGAEDSAAIHNDGKVATALIQEHRFNQYCMRLQGLVCAPLDKEFKAFLKWRGFNIDNSMFDLRMNEPQNFAQYRQAEVDNSRIQAFSQVEALPYMSKRFLMKRFLGLTEEEMLENNQLWREENTKPADVIQSDTSLRNVGVSAGGLESDITGLEEPPMPEMGAEGGAEGGLESAPPVTGAPAAGAPPPAV
jgi:hypothetical protein